jgi:hypothetical protein
MRPNADSDSAREDKPDFLPPDPKLEAGYIRYIRMLPTQGPYGEIRLETCIHRSQSAGESDRNPMPELFFYSAISYSWGDPIPSYSHVTVDGHQRHVATNLLHFLEHARVQYMQMQGDEFSDHECKTALENNWRYLVKEWSEEKPQPPMLRFRHPIENRMQATKERLASLHRRKWPEGWLWIDALCIDQSDARERTHQVGIMSEIFGGAEQVISWLGPAYHDSGHAMAAIAGYSNPYTSKHSKESSLSQAELAEAICSLCERPYWKRLWIFQELRHAQRIQLMCGTTRISWDQFTQLWRVIVDIAATDEDSSDRLKQSLATRMMTLRAKPMNFSLWNLLKETRNLECANRLDRVYALLSVATKGHEDIEADYHLEHLRLAHRTLHNKYAMRQPGTLDDVLMDCEFLEGVFRMNRGDMLRYRRYDAGCDHFSRVRYHWYWLEFLRSEGTLTKEEKSDHEEVTSYIDIESPLSSSSWAVWADFHEHSAVTRLP